MKCRWRGWLASTLFLLSAFAAAGQTMDERAGRFGDQGDGSYVNPILPGDFQNTDVIRVGGIYYYIVATKAMSPGMAVMQSDDLVNWSMIGHVVPDITVFSPRFNWDKMDGIQRGVWAGTMAYHAGLFYVYFTTPDEGIYVSTAKSAAGPWSPLKTLLAAPGWDDPAPLFDDDGKAYLAATNFSLDPSNGKTYNIHLFEMTPDGLSLKPGTDRIIYQARGSEANKLYKFNGLYFHFFSQVTAEGRVPMMGRAKDIAGPYEIRQLMHVDTKADRGPNQGSILQVDQGQANPARRETGKWVFVTHHGTPEWEGRPASVLPITWGDGWPVPGKVGTDGIGNMLWTARMPVPAGITPPIKATEFKAAPFVDEFDRSSLRPEWEWYFQPKPGAWSLTERPGFLRLRAVRPLAPGDLLKTADILTVRPLRVTHNVATVKMDVSKMVEGQRSGLCLLGRSSAAVGVVQDANGRAFYVSPGSEKPDVAVPDGGTQDGRIIAGSHLAAGQTVVWLRTEWDAAGIARFSVSTDGTKFASLGAQFQITSFGAFLGARIGLFSENDLAEAGFVDMDSFRYSYGQ